MNIAFGFTNLSQRVYAVLATAVLLFTALTTPAYAIGDTPLVTGGSFSIAENSPNATLIGQVIASDPDSPLTFAIVSGNTNNAFAIDPSSGQITVNSSAALDYEVTPSFSLGITVTDSDAPASVGTDTATITLTNVNDVAPVAVSDSAYSVNVNTPLSVPATGVLGNDSDVDGPSLTATAAAGSTTGGGSYSLSTDGSFTYTPTTDFSGPDTFTYTAFDGALTSSPATVTITVNKLVQTTTFTDPADVTYGDATSVVIAPTASSGLTVTVVATGACTNTGFTINFLNVGTCTVTTSQSGDAVYSAATDVVQTFNIVPRAVTVTATATNKVYDTTTSSVGVPTLTSGSLAFLETATYSQTYADEDVANGITLNPASSLDSNPNYSVTHVTALGNITPATLTATVVAANKEYDGNTTTTVVPTVIPLAGDTVTATYTTATFDTKDVGTGKTVTVSGIALTGADALNYVLSSTSATDGADITAKALTVDVSVSNKTYDNTTAATITGYTPVGLVGGEVVTINGGTATFATEHIGIGKGVSVSGLNLVADSVSGNYSFTTTDSTTANITARTITVTAQAETKVYDGTTDGFELPTITLGNLALGDTEDFLQTYDAADAGTSLTLTPSGVVEDGNGGANYNVNFVDQNVGTITKAPLTITADDKTKMYGDANPAATASYTGFVNGELESVLDTPVTLVVVASTHTDVGDAPITAVGASDANYSISFENGNLVVTKRPITVSVAAAGKVYDGNTATTATLTPVGVLFADVVTAAHTGATFADANVGVGKTVTAAGITLGGADAGNYSVAATETGLATITQRPITIAATAGSKVYGASDPAFGYTISAGALQGSDTVSGALSRVPGEDVGAYSITVGSLTAGNNYLETFSAANFTITQATLTATADNKTKVYGQVNPALTISYTGFQNGDNVADIDSAPVASTAVGQYGDVGGYAITVAGGTDNNYVFSPVSGTLLVTPLAITATVTANNKVYDATTGATASLSVAASLLNGDSVSATYSAAVFGTKDGGTGKPVAVTGIALSGTDAGNYTVTSTASGSADITVRPVVITADNKTKVYGAVDPTPTYVVTLGYELVGRDSFSGAIARTAGEGVNSYVINQGTLDAGSNYSISFTNGVLTITPAVLTVTAENKTRVYNTINPTLTVVYSGFKNGDDENDLTTPANASTLATISSGVGAYAIAPAGALGDNYTMNFVDGSLTITKAGQTITFGVLSDVNFGVADFSVSASSNSLLSVAFVASGACTVTGSTVHITTKGTCTITVSQVGDTNWNAASNVARSFEVLDVTAPVITLKGDTAVSISVGSTYTDAGATATDDVDGSLTGSIVSVSTVTTDTAGTYTVTYNVTDGSGNNASTVTRTVEVVARHSGGSSGGPVGTTPAVRGRVLGASSYNFATELGARSVGADVTELQKVLIAGGFLKIAAPTGYYGPMTVAAVKLYQAAHGIPTTGYVGPRTLAALNAEGTPTKTVEEQIAELMAKLKLLQAQAGQ